VVVVVDIPGEEAPTMSVEGGEDRMLTLMFPVVLLIQVFRMV